MLIKFSHMTLRHHNAKHITEPSNLQLEQQSQTACCERLTLDNASSFAPTRVREEPEFNPIPTIHKVLHHQLANRAYEHDPMDMQKKKKKNTMSIATMVQRKLVNFYTNTFKEGTTPAGTRFSLRRGWSYMFITTSVPNGSSFDFFTLSLTTDFIQKICVNITKFKSFLNILY